VAAPIKGYVLLSFSLLYVLMRLDRVWWNSCQFSFLILFGIWQFQQNVVMWLYGLCSNEHVNDLFATVFEVSKLVWFLLFTRWGSTYLCVIYYVMFNLSSSVLRDS
jgi:hypothetical protein